MAVAVWWAERLRNRHPIGKESIRVAGYNYKERPESVWPAAVAKQALLQDYQAWFEEIYLVPYQASVFYQDYPHHLPKPAAPLDFFVTMSPYLHLVDPKKQTRSYLVWQDTRCNGEWVRVKVRRNFVRLCEWDVHVAQFELLTGLNVASYAPDLPATQRDKEAKRVEKVAKGVQVIVRRLSDNKDALPEALKGVDTAEGA